MPESENATLTNSEPPAKKRGGGPKTPEGKARSAQNATRHGLTSRSICLATEDQAAFNHLRQSYLAEFQPVGFLELDLLDEMVLARWRQRRVAATETAAIDFELFIQADDDPMTETDLPKSTRTARAIRAMQDDSTDLANYSRYETRFHRMYHRALKQLIDIQDRRKAGKPVVTPVPVEPLLETTLNFQNELRTIPRLTTTQVIDYAIADTMAAVLSDELPIARPLRNVHLRKVAAG